MTNGTTTTAGLSQGDCDYCDAKNVPLSNGQCIDCAARNMTTNTTEVKSDQVEVTPSTTPINDRLKKAYIDKFNALMVSGMTPEQIKYHIADLEDMIKVLNTQLQATMDVDEEWGANLDKADREALREKDKTYRAKARPKVNSDGTLKTVKAAKPKQDVDEGTKAFDSLVEKLMRTGMTKENAVKLIQGMK